MGRQIVYCEGCGHNLREDDFERGRARMIDHKPFCAECRPFAEGEITTPRRASSGKVPVPPPQRKTSTGHIPIVPPPAQRRPGMGAPPKPSNPLPLILGVGAVLFIILIFVVTQGSDRRPPPAAEPPAPTPVEPAPRRPVPPPVVETPPPPPPPARRDPGGTKPSPPLAAPSAEERFQAFLNQIATIIREDVRKERVEEIINMFAAAAKTAGVRATEVEKQKQEYLATLDEPLRRAALWAEWKVTSGVDKGSNAILASHEGRESVYFTHPIDRNTPATLEREIDLPAGKRSTLHFWVSCHQQGDFELRVYADGKQLVKEMVGPAGSGWKEKSIDLTPFAGKRVALRLEDFPNNWDFEHAYWSDVTVTSE